jgi:hypothetical protein
MKGTVSALFDQIKPGGSASQSKSRDISPSSSKLSSMMTFLAIRTTQRVLPRFVFDSFRTFATVGRGKNAPYTVDYASLRVFEGMHGHLKVPALFTLSPDTPGVGWQASRIGRHVSDLRSFDKYQPHRIHQKDRVVLTKMGFAWDIYKERFQLLIEGILAYHKLNGDFLVPKAFVVPDRDPLWPEKWRGYKLGQKYHTLRHTEDLSV